MTGAGWRGENIGKCLLSHSERNKEMFVNTLHLRTALSSQFPRAETLQMTIIDSHSSLIQSQSRLYRTSNISPSRSVVGRLQAFRLVESLERTQCRAVSLQCWVFWLTILLSMSKRQRAGLVTPSWELNENWILFWNPIPNCYKKPVCQISSLWTNILIEIS